MRKRTRHLDRRHLNWLLPSGRNNFSAAGNPTAVAAYSAFFLPPVLELTDAARLLLSPLPASCISMFSCTRFPHCRLSLLSVPLSPSTPYMVIDWWDCGILPSTLVNVPRQGLAAAGTMHPLDEACPMCQHLGFAFSASPGSFILPQLFCLVQFTHYPGVPRVSFLNIRLWHDHFQNVLIISDRIQKSQLSFQSCVSFGFLVLKLIYPQWHFDAMFSEWMNGFRGSMEGFCSQDTMCYSRSWMDLGLGLCWDFSYIFTKFEKFTFQSTFFCM